MLYYKSFDKYLIQQLNNNIKNDIKEKFLENNIPLDEDIIDSMKKTLKTKIILFTQKQFHLLIKYLTFGKEKIYQSRYLLKSGIDEFLKSLFTFILGAKKSEDEQIYLNFKKCFEILDESVFKEDKEIFEYDNEDENWEDYEEDERNNKENKVKILWDEVNETLINKI